MTKSMSARILSAVLCELEDRSGFDAWWYGIDYDIREDIIEELERAISRELERKTNDRTE